VKFLVGAIISFMLAYNLHWGLVGSMVIGFVTYNIIDAIWDRL